MTPEILLYLETIVKPLLMPSAGRVLEVGAFNVNGSPRAIIQPIASEYIGTDMRAGQGVDYVMHNLDLCTFFEEAAFNTIICCECLEHDEYFQDTVAALHTLLKPGGYLVITTPHFGFPVHRFPKDYWRFGEDAYREVFFDGMDILDLRLLDSAPLGREMTVAGIARKR